MSGPLGSQQWMYATETPPFYSYPIDNSLRFDGASKLTATPPSASNRGKFTISCWIKRSALGADQRLFEGWGGSTSNWTVVSFTDVDTLQIQNRVSGSAVLNYVSSAKYRDVGAWYHIVIRFDLAGTGLKVWVNGSEVTQWSASTFSTANTFFNSSSYNLNIGYYQGTATQYLSGYMADTHFVDNQALSATDFGELKSGIWVPKEYTGTYGTNGFHLDFADGTSATTLGYDVSGNSNNFTPSGIATSDQMLDSPTNNFATWDPLDKSSLVTLSEGNLQSASGTSPVYPSARSNFVMSSGKWYAEFFNLSAYTYIAVTTFAEYARDADSGANKVFSSTSTASQKIMVAVDADSGKVWFGTNGTWDSGDPAAGTSPTGTLTGEDFVVYTEDRWSGQAPTLIVNYGQDSSFAGNQAAQNNADGNGYGDFFYAPPSGFLALCTQNLPNPTFDPAQGASPQGAFSVDLDADGAGALTTAQAVFPTGIWWLKDRTLGSDHLLVDSARGSTLEINPNSTAIESTYSDPSNSSVSWSWKAATTVSGTTTGSGTLKSYSGYANATAGVSVITYEGNGTAGHQIPHHLGAAPSVVVVKNRDYNPGNWMVYHEHIDASPETCNILLNGSSAKTSSVSTWNSTLPSASVVSLGDGPNENRDTDGHVLYAFAEKDGFSKFGVYSGNYNVDGPFVYLGFRPAFVMIKATGGTSGKWAIFDSARDGYNVDNDALHVYPVGSEDTTDQLDLLSNGFKVRVQIGDLNNNAYEYIYMAFAEQPFKYSNAR